MATCDSQVMDLLSICPTTVVMKTTRSWAGEEELVIRCECPHEAHRVLSRKLLLAERWPRTIWAMVVEFQDLHAPPLLSELSTWGWFNPDN